MNKASNKNTVLLVAALSAFLNPFMSSSVNIALPSVGHEFGADAVLLSWVVTSYLLASAIFLVPFGRIADIYGQKKLFIYGIVVFTVSSLLAAASPSVSVLIFARAFQGLGSAMTLSTSKAMLTSAFPVSERGKALGISVAVTYIGLTLGPFVGGLLTQHFGWRSIFFATVPLGLAVILSGLSRLKGEWNAAKGERFDLSGSIIYGLALVTVIYGLSLVPDISSSWMIALGVLGILVFIKWELRTASPVLNMNLFRNNRLFAFSNLAALLNYSATYAVTFLLSLYLQYIKGLGPQDAGLVLVAMPLMQAVFSPLTGRLSDRIEPRLLASTGMGLSTAGLAMLVFVDRDTSLNFVILTLFILGFGFALFSSPNVNAIMSSVEKRSYGVASATLDTMRLVGMMFSVSIAMLVFNLFIGKVEIGPESQPALAASLKVAFGIFTSFSFGGVFISLIRGKLR